MGGKICPEHPGILAAFDEQPDTQHGRLTMCADRVGSKFIPGCGEQPVKTIDDPPEGQDEKIERFPGVAVEIQRHEPAEGPSGCLASCCPWLGEERSKPRWPRTHLAVQNRPLRFRPARPKSKPVPREGFEKGLAAHHDCLHRRSCPKRRTRRAGGLPLLACPGRDSVSCIQSNEVGTDLPEPQGGGGVVALFGGFLGLAVGEVAARHVLQVRR